MTKAAKAKKGMRAHYSTRNTPQNQPIPGKQQVKNNAGGYVFALDDWSRLDRFLILGTEGGTYYVSERKLTVENAEAVARCLLEDGVRAVSRIVEISESGRAPKNDPALFALAMAASFDSGDGAPSLAVRQAALAALPRVARTGTHLFHFAEYVEGFRGWGRTLKRAVANWYNEQPIDKLANQVIKYKQRDGWSHRDLLRLSHPRATGENQMALAALYEYVCRGGASEHLPARIKAAESLRTATKKEAVFLIREHGLPREAVPTEMLNDADVWKALLEDMPMHALVRNLGKLTAVEAIKPLSKELANVAAQLRDAQRIRKSRLHPLALLDAQRVYAAGHGDKGKLRWAPHAAIVEALEEAFYLAFGNVEPTNKRIMLGIDVSGSMAVGKVSGANITPREAAAALALVHMATEKSENLFVMGFQDKFVPLKLSKGMRLSDACEYMAGLSFGNTDCALPAYYALDNGLEVDAFVVLTDSETWVGTRGHPSQALAQYRKKSGIPARMIVCGMASNGFTIADPADPLSLDVVGMDTATPVLISDFIR